MTTYSTLETLRLVIDKVISSDTRLEVSSAGRENCDGTCGKAFNTPHTGIGRKEVCQLKHALMNNCLCFLLLHTQSGYNCRGCRHKRGCPAYNVGQVPQCGADLYCPGLRPLSTGQG